jgi:proline iminopeptidase
VTTAEPGAGASLELRDGAEGYLPIPPGIRLWYRITGHGPGTVVVPANGNADEIAALTVPGHRVLAYDVRGRGRSDAVLEAQQLGFSFEVSDLEAVRAAFAIERISVLAWSYRAGVAAVYAMQRPERVERLVLVASIPLRAGLQPGPARTPAPHQLAQLDQLEASGLREADPTAFCAAWRGVYVPLLMGDPTGFERMSPICGLVNEHPWNAARALVHVFAELGSYDWRPALRELDVPVLVVHGTEDQDPIERATEWVDSLRSGRLYVMDGVGQFPWVEQPDRFFPLVNRFLAGESV